MESVSGAVPRLWASAIETGRRQWPDVRRCPRTGLPFGATGNRARASRRPAPSSMSWCSSAQSSPMNSTRSNSS